MQKPFDNYTMISSVFTYIRYMFKGVQLDAQHQTDAPDFTDSGVLQVLAKQLGLSFNIIDEVFIDNNLERCQSGRTTYRMPDAGGDVTQTRVVFDHINHSFVGSKCTNRHAAYHTFCHHREVRFTAIL